MSTRFVSNRFVSNEKNSFREHSFREQQKKLVSWALVSWATKKTRFVSTRFVSTRFVSSRKNSFREHSFREQRKKLVSWANSRVSWAKVLTSLLTSLVISDCIFSYLFCWIDIPSTYPTPKFSQVPMYSSYRTHCKANNVGPYYLDQKLLNGMLLLFQS